MADQQTLTCPAPALPQELPNGWTITCLRCFQTTGESRNLSVALTQHNKHRCR